jgi:hypothetical protein
MGCKDCRCANRVHALTVGHAYRRAPLVSQFRTALRQLLIRVVARAEEFAFPFSIFVPKTLYCPPRRRPAPFVTLHVGLGGSHAKTHHFRVYLPIILSLA